MSMFGASNRRFIGAAQDTAGRSRRKKRSLFAGLAKKRKPAKSKKRSR